MTRTSLATSRPSASSQLALVLREGGIGHEFPHRDDGGVLVGNLDADVREAGHRRFDAHTRRGEGERQVIGEVHHPAHLDALTESQAVLGNGRAPDGFGNFCHDLKTAQCFLDDERSLLDLLGRFFRIVRGIGGCEQFRRRQLPARRRVGLIRFHSHSHFRIRVHVIV